MGHQKIRKSPFMEFVRFSLLQDFPGKFFPIRISGLVSSDEGARVTASLQAHWSMLWETLRKLKNKQLELTLEGWRKRWGVWANLNFLRCRLDACYSIWTALGIAFQKLGGIREAKVVFLKKENDGKTMQFQFGSSCPCHWARFDEMMNKWIRSTTSERQLKRRACNEPWSKRKIS